MAEARGVAITIADGLPSITIEVARLELILLNLLSNGIKYSDPAKAVRYIEVGGDPTVAADGSWTISIRDNGLGVPHELQPAIFDRFFRAHEHLDTKLGVSGSGLGLSIVVDCVDALGAAIGFESEPGQGTTFRVTFQNVGSDPP